MTLGLCHCLQDQEDDSICATKKVDKISALPSPHDKYKKRDTPLTDLQNILNTISPSKNSTTQELCSNVEDIVSEKGLESDVSQEVSLVASITTVPSNLSDSNLPSASSPKNYHIVEGVIIEEVIVLHSSDESITEKKKSHPENNLPVDISLYPAIVDLSGPSERLASCSKSPLSPKQDLPLSLITITATNVTNSEDSICAAKNVDKIGTLSSPHYKDKKCVTPFTDIKNNILLTISTPKNTIRQELYSSVGDTISEKGLESGVSQEVSLAVSLTSAPSNLSDGNLHSASNPQAKNDVESVIIEEDIGLRSPGESITEKIKSNEEDNLPVDVSLYSEIAALSGPPEQLSSNSKSFLSDPYPELPLNLITNVTNSQLMPKNAEQEICSKYENLLAPENSNPSVVNAGVNVTGFQHRLNEAEQESRSKPTSPSLIEDANSHLIPPPLLPDLQNYVHLLNEPIEDDQYPNLSIQTADIVLDSPCSSFNIPSPYTSVNSPVATDKKKRNCEKRKGPGKIRTTNLSEWKDVKRKELKNLGREYTNRKGEIKEEKKMKPPCSSKCIKKCSENIEETEREYIFKCYWELGSHERQWDFISKFVSSHEPKRIKAKGPNRSRIMKYTLPTSNDSKSVAVCRTMFLNTLSISEKPVRTLFDKQSSVNENVHKVTDLRGRHRNRPKKLSDNILNSVKDHVNALAPVESHYCRKSSSKKYLDGQLSYKRLHLLYLEWFDEKIYGSKKATLRQYQDIVNSNFNIAFYTPKKDQCDKCHAYKNIKEPTEQQKTEQEIHLQYKTLARSLKEINKTEAEKCQNGEIVTACFDMQKILTCPFGNVSIFYYKRKLNLYNFTVYDMSQKNGYCYMWSEANGKKGANEVCSGLMLFMQSKIDGGTKQFKFWSDNCSGQNRNRIVFALYQYIVQKYDVESITHRFLEVGHTQNEGDSVHSVIEGASNNRTIYTPEQWFNLIRWAKTSGEAYRVQEMTINDIQDCRVLLEGKNWTKNNDNEKVAWGKVKEIHVSKENINTIKYKYQLNEEYKVITTLKRKTRGKTNDVVVNLKQANTSLLQINNDKYKDLTYLCEKKIIPEEFHSYFKSLPHDQTEGNRSNNSDHDQSEED